MAIPRLFGKRIRPWLAERTVDEVVELGQLFRLPIAALGNGATIRDTAYARERGAFVENPAGFHQPRTPWLMSQCKPAALRGAPALGEADDTKAWPMREYRGSPSDPGCLWRAFASSI